MPGIVDTIPTAVGISTSTQLASYTHSSYEYDYAINGLPFLAATDPQKPNIRKTAPYRKARFDNGIDPGEQSLEFWWMKSQSTFHGGAGQLYIDTPVIQGAEIRPLRFQNSVGVTPWTQGQVSLLKDVAVAQAHATAAAATKVLAIQVGTTNYIVYGDGLNVQVLTETTPGSAYTLRTAGALTGNVQSICTDGRLFYATDGNTVVSGDPSAGALTTLYTGMGGGTAVLGWSKLMLMLGFKNSVYILSNTASAAALPTATFNHPTSAFIWTCVAEGSGAVYMGGYAGIKSVVYKFVLSTSSITPTVTSGIAVADFPPGELLFDMFAYLNSNIGFATSLGVRVGQFQNGADFSYGPLSVLFSSPQTAGAIVGADRFFFAAYNDTSGLSGVSSVASLVRVDQSAQLSIRPYTWQPDMRFAWAPDLRANNNGFKAGTPTGVAVLPDGRKVFVVPGQAVYVENPNAYTPSGQFTTSRIRFDTLDPKLAKFVRLRGSGAAGTIAVQVNQDSDSGGPNAYTMSLSNQQDSGDVRLNLSKFTYVTCTFTLTAGSSNTVTPVMLGYQLKCLPAQTRQRFIEVQLLCFDKEQSPDGQQIGYDGSALSRLQQLEALDAAGDIVNFQVLSPYADNQYTSLAVIEDLTFTQTSAPTQRQGWGGIITLTLRTVTVST